MLSLALLFALVLFFQSFSIVKRELVYVLLVHLLVYLACVDRCPTSLPLGVGDWLQLVIVALPGLFYELFHRVCPLGGFHRHSTKLVLYKTLKILIVSPK